jgi:hypothetical protein
MTHFTRHIRTGAVAIAAGLGVLFLYAGPVAQAQSAPRYKFDPDFPKPLPNKWKIGGVMGISIMADDSLWVYNRPNDMTNLELGAETTPPLAECCVRPPSMIHFDKQGNVIGSFVAPQGHGMDTDSKGFAYLGQDTVRKYEMSTGKMVGEVPRAPEREGGGPNRPAELPKVVPGQGGQGPIAGFLPPPPGAAGRGGRGGRGNADPAAQAAATAAFYAKYPPTTPMIVGGIEEVRVDEANRELFVADSYLGGRVMVFNLDTFAFKRGWGARGKPLSEISTNDADHVYTPGGPPPKDYVGHLTLAVSNDGLVYAADRRADRVDVTTRDGKFIKEFMISPMTPSDRGAAGGVAFSADKEQRYLIISDMANSHVWFLNRADGKVLGQFGTMGDQGGLFYGLHMVEVDSRNYIYTGEVFAGERIQRFVPSDSARGKLLEQLSALP